MLLSYHQKASKIKNKIHPINFTLIVFIYLFVFTLNELFMKKYPQYIKYYLIILFVIIVFGLYNYYEIADDSGVM